jgi:hypothetical protein
MTVDEWFGTKLPLAWHSKKALARLAWKDGRADLLAEVERLAEVSPLGSLRASLMTLRGKL